MLGGIELAGPQGAAAELDPSIIRKLKADWGRGSAIVVTDARASDILVSESGAFFPDRLAPILVDRDLALGPLRTRRRIEGVAVVDAAAFLEADELIGAIIQATAGLAELGGTGAAQAGRTIVDQSSGFTH